MHSGGNVGVKQFYGLVIAGFLNLGYLSLRGYAKSSRGYAESSRGMQIIV